jgi:hypothetical protein
MAFLQPYELHLIKNLKVGRAGATPPPLVEAFQPVLVRHPTFFFLSKFLSEFDLTTGNQPYYLFAVQSNPLYRRSGSLPQLDNAPLYSHFIN